MSKLEKPVLRVYYLISCWLLCHGLSLIKSVLLKSFIQLSNELVIFWNTQENAERQRERNQKLQRRLFLVTAVSELLACLFQKGNSNVMVLLLSGNFPALN